MIRVVEEAEVSAALAGATPAAAGLPATGK